MQYVPFLPKNIIILSLSLPFPPFSRKSGGRSRKALKNRGEFYSASRLFVYGEEVGRGSPYIRSEEKERERRKLVSRGREKTAFVADGRNVGPFLARRIRVKVSVPWRR